MYRSLPDDVLINDGAPIDAITSDATKCFKPGSGTINALFGFSGTPSFFDTHALTENLFVCLLVHFCRNTAVDAPEVNAVHCKGLFCSDHPSTVLVL